MAATAFVALSTLAMATSSAFHPHQILINTHPEEPNSTKLEGCTCANNDGTIRVQCVNVSDFSAWSRRLAEIFKSNSTEIVLMETSSIPSGALKSLNVSKLLIIDTLSDAAKDAFQDMIWMKEFHVMKSHLEEIPDLYPVRNSLDVVKVDNSLLTEVQGEFQNLPLLIFLSLKNNNISVIAEDAFKGSGAISTLDLSYNTLVSLPKGLLNGLKTLRTLDLSHNHLITVEGILDFIKPKFVLLSYNNLTNIEDLIPYYNGYLESLHLDHNPLGRITNQTFGRKIANIRHLYLNHTNLTEFNVNYFEHMAKLSTLELSGNLIASIPRQNFVFGESLDIVFNDNLIETFEGMILFQVRSVSVARNRLTLLHNAFKQSQPISIDLSGNRLIAIEGDNFDGVHETEKIIFSSNVIERIDSRSFTYIRNDLRKLDLSMNKLKSLNGSVQYLSKLTSLDISCNQISLFSDSEFVGLNMLSELRAQNNRIIALTGQLETLPELKLLNLQNNWIQTMDMKNVSKTLQLISIKGREDGKHHQGVGLLLSRHASDALLGYECINEMFLTAKFQTSIKDLNVICCYAPTENSDEDEKDRFYRQLQDILNSVKKGDITLVLGDFNAKVGTDSDLWGGVIGPFGIGSCNGNGQRLLTNNPIECDCRLLPFLQWLQNPNLTNNTKKSDVDLCQSLEEPPPLPCPEPCLCSCTHDANGSYVSMDCSSRHLMTAPPFSNSSSPSDHFFVRISNSQFLISDQVLAMDFENNNISTLKDIPFPSNLKKLYLANNLLNSLPQSVMHLSNLHRITLANNPWTCDCSTGEFRKFLLSKMAGIRDVNITKCHSHQGLSNLNDRVIVSLSDLDLCPADVGLYITVTFGLLSFLLLCAALKITYNRYELNIKVFLYSHGVSWVKEKDIDQNKPFDAFISFSNGDETFVVKEIVAEIENRCPTVRLCLHYRHFLPGEFIHDNIINAVKCSKRTILVLTKNFLESEWCLMEFRAAHLQALEDKVHRIVIIKVGKLPEDMDPAIKVYLDSTTYLTWGEKYFWQKLLYSLPSKEFKASPRNPS